MAMDGTIYPPPILGRPLHAPILCFSPHRWGDATRLRELMARFARQRDVFFLEEPLRSDAGRLQIRPCPETSVQVVTPLLPEAGIQARRQALDLLLARSGVAIAWHAAPESLAFSDHAAWLATVYDCTEEPSAAARPLERRLLQEADLVFAGGAGLHEDRRDLHPNLHYFPDGIDLERLEAARRALPEPADQIGLRRPLLGRVAPVDDRLDLRLLAGIAALRPHWQFVMIGEIATARELPRPDNIHWLGPRKDAKLPAYLSHWDVAVMPLAHGAIPEAVEAPSYLAAGRRVVATPVREITRRFARMEAVATAENARLFVAAAEEAMRRADVSDFVAVDDMLATLSWDAIHRHMAALLKTAERNAASTTIPLSRLVGEGLARTGRIG